MHNSELKFTGLPLMTLRQWYAGMALQGMLSYTYRNGDYTDYAIDAFRHADAMIAHEKKEQEYVG